MSGDEDENELTMSFEGVSLTNRRTNAYPTAH